MRGAVPKGSENSLTLWRSAQGPLSHLSEKLRKRFSPKLKRNHNRSYWQCSKKLLNWGPKRREVQQIKSKNLISKASSLLTLRLSQSQRSDLLILHHENGSLWSHSMALFREKTKRPDRSSIRHHCSWSYLSLWVSSCLLKTSSLNMTWELQKRQALMMAVSFL